MSASDFSFPVLIKGDSDYDKTGSRAVFHVAPNQVKGAAREFYKKNFFIEDVTGQDLSEGFEVVYHFDSFEGSKRCTVRCLVPHDDPKVPSIADIFHGAEWHERETHDFFGIVFEGNPNPVALLLDPEAGIHPLVKDEKKRKEATEIMEDYLLAECWPSWVEKEEEVEEGEESGEAAGEES